MQETTMNLVQSHLTQIIWMEMELKVFILDASKVVEIFGDFHLAVPCKMRGVKGKSDSEGEAHPRKIRQEDLFTGIV